MAVAAESVYIAAESIPEIGDVLQVVRDRAWETVQQREELIAEGRFDEVPLAIDALSTAAEVVGAREESGWKSPQYREKLDGLEQDTGRLVAEWHRKLKPAAFPKARHNMTEDGDVISHGLSIRQMTDNALRPIAGNPEETARRVNERVEQEVPGVVLGAAEAILDQTVDIEEVDPRQELARKRLAGFALGQCGIRTISMATQKSLDDLARDQEEGNPHTGYDGYVPEVDKIMLRDVRYDPSTGEIIQEQMAVLGLNTITEFVIKEALKQKGIDASQLDRTGIHGMQMLVDDDLVDFVKLLDEEARKEWLTPNIFRGERVEEGHPMDYDSIRLEAEQEQEDLQPLVDITNSFLVDLVEDDFDRREAPHHVENFVKQLLLKKAKSDITVARQMFGEKTVEGLMRVAELERAGRHAEAFQLMEEVEEKAEGGGFCSGGSCGLQSVDRNSEEGKDLAKKLKARDGDEIVKDKERKCKCGARTVTYAYSKDHVNKYCETCKAFESKRTK